MRPRHASGLLFALAACPCPSLLACNDPPGPPNGTNPALQASSSPPRPAAAPAPPEPARAPDILVDATNVSIGTERVPARELALRDKVAMLLKDRPAVGGQTVDVVAMRAARPSAVLEVVAALRRAGATGAGVKTEARDGTTQRLALSYAPTVADCTTVAWIAKDGAIDIWPAGGGRAKRIVKGLAGPDMTLGGDAVHERAGICNATELLVGADDALSWGLAFDLATGSLRALGAPANAALLISHPTPGRQVILPGH